MNKSILYLSLLSISILLYTSWKEADYFEDPISMIRFKVPRGVEVEQIASFHNEDFNEDGKHHVFSGYRLVGTTMSFVLMSPEAFMQKRAFTVYDSKRNTIVSQSHNNVLRCGPYWPGEGVDHLGVNVKIGNNLLASTYGTGGDYGYIVPLRSNLILAIEGFSTNLEDTVFIADEKLNMDILKSLTAVQEVVPFCLN